MKELNKVTPRSLPEYEDDSLGHKYMTLWKVTDRENTSFEKLTAQDALMAGRIDFVWDFNDKSKKPYMYYLEVNSNGQRQAALFQKMVGSSKTDGLLNYINMGHPVKLNSKTTSYHFLEFDATKKPLGDHEDDAWTNTGVVEIGCYYVDMNNWETIKLNPAGEVSVHITIDADDFRDIEVCAITKSKDSAVYRFRRDLPILKPVDYRQTCMIGNNRLHMKLHNDTDFVVDLSGSSDDKITQLYWRHIN